MYRSKTLVAGLLAAGLVMGATAAAFGHGMQGQGQMPGGGPGMGQGHGQGQGQGHGQGQGMRMDPGMHYGNGMGQGMMMGPGMGRGHGQGQGMMMGPGMGRGHGQGQGMMMGPGTGRGMGPGLVYGWPAAGEQDLSVEDARGWLERKLAWHGNPRLKLGEVLEVDEDTIVAEIVTKDGSLVQKFAIDRRSGVLRQLDD